MKTTKVSQSSEEQLLNDLFVLVLQFLDNPSLATAASTSHSWSFQINHFKSIRNTLMFPRAKNYINTLVANYMDEISNLRGPRANEIKTIPTYADTSALAIARRLRRFEKTQVKPGKLNLTIASVNHTLALREILEISQNARDNFLAIMNAPIRGYMLKIFGICLLIADCGLLWQGNNTPSVLIAYNVLISVLSFLLAPPVIFSAALLGAYKTNFLTHFQNIPINRVLQMKTIIAEPFTVLRSYEFKKPLTTIAYRKALNIPTFSEKLYANLQKKLKKIQRITTDTLSSFTTHHPVALFLLSAGIFNNLFKTYYCTANYAQGSEVYNALLSTVESKIHEDQNPLGIYGPGSGVIPFPGLIFNITQSPLCKALFQLRHYPYELHQEIWHNDVAAHCQRIDSRGIDSNRIFWDENSMCLPLPQFTNHASFGNPSTLLITGTAAAYAFATHHLLDYRNEQHSGLKKTLINCLIFGLILLGIDALTGCFGLLNNFSLRFSTPLADPIVDACARACNDGFSFSYFNKITNESSDRFQMTSPNVNECSNNTFSQTSAGMIHTAMATLPAVPSIVKNLGFFCKKKSTKTVSSAINPVEVHHPHNSAS